MPLTPEGRDFAAAAIGAEYNYLALFDGASELSGAGYARIQFTADAGATQDGVVSIPATGPFNVPSGANVTAFAIFNDPTATAAINRGGLENLSAPTGAYAADGEFNFTGGTITVTST